MSILNFLITKRNILTSGLSILLLLFHYNGIHNLIRSIEVEKEKRDVLISNLIKNNIDYNLSLLRDFITKFETAPALVNKELVAGSIAKDLFKIRKVTST